MYSIAIIGAGWYGCHIGLTLKNFGHDVTIFEKNETVLLEASGNNQFRLHAGFHYPRHARTRKQSYAGFKRFHKDYPTLISTITENIYAVSSTESLMDFETYGDVMFASDIPFSEIKTPNWLANVEGCLRTSEQVVLTEKARKYFVDILGNSLCLCHPILSPRLNRIDELEEYDYIIDATWGHLTDVGIPVYYEPTMLLYYETKTPGFPAVTLVDGPLCSVYPTEDLQIYTLSDVVHTPLGQYVIPQEAGDFLRGVDKKFVNKKVRKMEEHIRQYIPSFNDHFRFVGPQLSVKTKPFSESGDRSCSVYRDGRVFSVMSGKIDTIFFAADEIVREIEKDG